MTKVFGSSDDCFMTDISPLADYRASIQMPNDWIQKTIHVEPPPGMVGTWAYERHVNFPPLQKLVTAKLQGVPFHLFKCNQCGFLWVTRSRFYFQVKGCPECDHRPVTDKGEIYANE